ncbi:MAG: SpoIIIAC/SpoIIIAD family protein [Clostridium sp.]
MEIVALCGIAVLAAVFSVMLKKYIPEYSFLISLGAGVLILLLILSKITPAVSQIKNLLSATGLSSEYGSILFKSLGVCFLTQFAADSCRDSGEGSMASKVELAGKVMIVLISLPLFEKIAETAMQLMGG